MQLPENFACEQTANTGKNIHCDYKELYPYLDIVNVGGPI